MAVPRIFVSSTFYDLKYVRDNLSFLISSLGYEPVLSEDGAVYYNPKLDTLDSAVAEVQTCQLFVLIIGGRSGTLFGSENCSITNAEYRCATKNRIPVFALVESSTLNDYRLYRENINNAEVDHAAIVYPSADDPRIFDFIHEVRSNAINNALVPFEDFSDIERYLKNQWAGMMFSFLTNQNEEERVSDMISALAEMNARIEMLSKQILRSVGTEDAKVDAAMYEEMLKSEAIRDLAYLEVSPTPASIFLNSSYRSCAKALCVELKIEETNGDDEYDGSYISKDGTISRSRFDTNSREYKKLRQDLTDILKEFNLTPEKYVKS